MAACTKRERLEAAIRGQVADRPPVALWRHFPGDDQDPSELARSIVEFQRQYDFDFVKVTPASSYCVQDWGSRDRWMGSEEGTRLYTHYPIQCPGGWAKLRVLDPTRGALGAQLRCLDLVSEGVGAGTPILETIFSPLAQAKNLAGKEQLLSHLRECPSALKGALEVITASTVDFITAAREHGISGIFLALQHASLEVLSRQEYDEFGLPYDRRLVEAAEGLWLNVLHLHGNQVMFDLVAEYRAQVVNWHDRETPPTLCEGRTLARGAVLGGLRQWETLVRGSPEDVRREARDAVEQTGGRGFILGTGCVAPITAPWANLRAARQAVERH